MCIDCSFWRKSGLIKVQEIKVDKQEWFYKIRSPSLAPHSLKDSSTRSHQLIVISNQAIKIIGNQANDSWRPVDINFESQASLNLINLLVNSVV